MDELFDDDAKPVVEGPEKAGMTATNEKDPCAGNTGSFGKHSLNGLDYRTWEQASKTLIIEEFAAAGYLLHHGSYGDFFIVRADLGMCCHCENLAEAFILGHQMGVINHG